MAKHAATVPFISLTLDPAAPRPLYRQLYDGIRAAILNGSLAPGSQLPATRQLSGWLGLSRFTVVSAFDQLLAEGFIEGHVGSGTFVSRNISETVVVGAVTVNTLKPDLPRRPRLSQRGLVLASTRGSTVSDEGRPRAFRAGQPALDHFPVAAWARIAARLYRRMSNDLLTYGVFPGYLPLRKAIASYLHSARGMQCRPEQVIIASGSQQALDLAARVLLDPGDPVWMEDPGYPWARAALQSAGAILVPVPVDAEGLDVRAGELLEPRARMAYVTPSYQYPLGVTMTLSRRLALLVWAQRTGAWILEDDYDSEFRYTGHPLASLAGLDASGQVIYMGTFSKVLFPALRLGYLVVPEDLIDAFSQAAALAGRHAPTLEQAVLADFIEDGLFAGHIRKMRTLYMERQAALVEAASADLAGLLEVRPSAAGMHVIGWLQPGTDDRAASRQAARHGVEVPPLSMYTDRAALGPGFLLGYTALTAQEIRRGTNTLAAALSPRI